MSHPRKKPKKLGKTSIFNTFETIPDTPKTNLLTLKPYNKQTPKKHHFSMFKNNPLFFINFLFFSTYSFCFWKAVFCWKHYKNSVSGKHSFSKTQLVKPTFSPMSKNTFFKKKVSFLLLGNFRWKHYFYSFSCFTLFWAQKNFWPKQIVCTKMRVFSPFLTQIVSANFCKKSIFFDFSHFCMTTLKNPIFIGFFAIFPFLFFFFSFFCFYFPT